MRYEIIQEQIKISLPEETSAVILKINAVYPRIMCESGDKFADAFNEMYEKAAKSYIKYAETRIKKEAEAQYALFASSDERFTPYGAVFKAKVAAQTDDAIHVHIDASAYPGRSKRLVHILDKNNIKFLKPKDHL